MSLMNQSEIHLLDLPNEMLVSILKKLDNIDVLHSLFDINNYRLHTLVMTNVFTNTLKFVTASTTDEYQSISETIIDRFCMKILSRINTHVQCLILEPTCMERILLAAQYSHLTRLKIYNFRQEILLSYFTDDSTIGDILKYQITDLILVNTDKYNTINSLKTYTTDVYAHVLTFFKHLTRLSIVNTSSNHDYPPLSLADIPSTMFHSTILTQLSITVSSFGDCFALLDGRLTQLSTLIVKIQYITQFSSTIQITDDLPMLKNFSLTCYDTTVEYDNHIVPLLRRMLSLENLTLYLRVCDRHVFIDGTEIFRNFLMYMSRLQSFTFYIATVNALDGIVRYFTDEDIQRTFTNIGLPQVACLVNYFRTFKAICHTFSLPFTFTRLEKIANRFPTMIFLHVTYLKAYDVIPFQHEFFHRISQSFPTLKEFCIMNYMPQSHTTHSSYSMINYPHLTSLDIKCVHADYIEQFLLETKTFLPCLIELKVNYDQVRSVTHNFTNETTRRNCLKIKRLIIEDTFVFPAEVRLYFPSL